MPCEHHIGEIARNGGLIGPARTIYCESWRYSGGYKLFELQEFYYIFDKTTNKYKKKWSKEKHFRVRYMNEDQVANKFLEFMKEKLFIDEWPDWVQAFRSLYFGGRGFTYPPLWRMNQLAKKAMRKNA